MSVMPAYTWYFDESTDPPYTKSQRPWPLVAYLQSLGAWASSVKRTQYDTHEIVMPPDPE